MAQQLLPVSPAWCVAAAMAGLLATAAAWAAPLAGSAAASDALPSTVPSPASAPAWLRERQTRPNFRAPAATTCADAPVLVEVPDPSGQQRPPRRPLGPPHPVSVFDDARRDAVPAPAPPAPPMPLSPAPRLPGSVGEGGSRHPGERPADVVTPAAVNAGMVDDNADFSAYQAFLQRHAASPVPAWPVAGRQRLQVVDALGRPVNDAEVMLRAANGARMWARTDAGGHVWIHPGSFDPEDSPDYQVQVRRDGQRSQGRLLRGQKPVLQLRLPVQPQPARLDLVFLVDATGSMADEIDKLRASLQDIVGQIDALPSRPQVCLGLVSYRDRGDEYFIRRWDLSHSVAGFQQVLDGVQAGGGGDTPEAMNEALHEAVQHLSWRGSGTTRLLISLADAPPHLDYGRPWHSDSLRAALGKGIKVFSVAASGQDSQGEQVQRQLAQHTGGRFIFLTYQDPANPAAGPGSDTVHEVANYSVDQLDALVVRLVREELAQLPAVPAH